ncbi:DUF1476 family protein [Rhodoblastus acidophilus]|jgi:hypothetical protein|uniref:DUF1476 family protein n=1 Tax=Rhodoblastus acidophilus TaxID=1074 RepID=A0A6N8DK66_RHOAC|nr:DUF1476 domain-containing protein [Rhodoblastus acidophilus]MCW2274213.1 hypothetical protein [Rhodoblastus acidophilus]MTV30777.1 DUF1476 family protein [Rhodoblastus acidophilus]
MSTFDKREDAYENKFAHDEELQFKAFAKAYKLLGLWAAEKLGKSGAAAEDYAKGLVAEGVVKHDSKAIIAQILKDFVGAGVEQSEHQITRHFEEFHALALNEIKNG